MMSIQSTLNTPKPPVTVLKPKRTTQFLWLLWSVLLLAQVGISFYPIRFGMLVWLIIALWFAWWSVTLALVWRYKPLRIGFLTLTGLAALFLVAPGRAVDTTTLRTAYLQSLESYEGVGYVWGGESRRGIDCSGLLRRGWMDANRHVGLQTLNPAPVRQALSLWLHDCSAKAMKEEYRGWTRTLFTGQKLNTLDTSRLQPGDIAVTSNGVHTLAYLGDKTWIQADPKAWKVVRETVPSKGGWFNMPVHLLRWRELDAS